MDFMEKSGWFGGFEIGKLLKAVSCPKWAIRRNLADNREERM